MSSYRLLRKALSTTSLPLPSPFSRRVDLPTPPVSPSEPPTSLPDVAGALAVQGSVDDELSTGLSVSVAIPSAEDDVVEEVRAEKTKALGVGLMDSPGNSVDASVSCSTQTIEENTLGVEIQKPREVASTHGENGGPRTWFPPPIPPTGTPIIDRVLEDLRVSHNCFWLADTPHINSNSVWRRDSTRPHVSMLQWKDYGGDDDREDGGGEDRGGDIILGMIGMVSSEANHTSSDADWQPGLEPEELYNYKRTLRIVLPSSESNIPQACCLAQFEGGYRLVRGGAPPSDAVGISRVARCFLNRQEGFMRFRSPIFTPAPVVPDDGEYDATPDGSLEDDNLPPSFGFDTWKMSSPLVATHFRRVVDSGYKPQPFPAYNRFGKLIHPNQVSATLAGAIVLVYFTLERMRSPMEGVRAEYRFFGNLVRLQVLKLPSPPKTVAKRKLVHTYGISDYYRSASLPADEPALKKLKLRGVVKRSVSVE